MQKTAMKARITGNQAEKWPETTQKIPPNITPQAPRIPVIG